MEKQRYGLVTWPESQDVIGVSGCYLVKPPKGEELELDSSYMVPLDEEDLKYNTGYVKVEFPESQRYADMEDGLKKEECFRDYSNNVFVREDLVKDEDKEVVAPPEKSLVTPCGRIRVGSVIHIDSIDATTKMSPDGVDRHALEMKGKTGTVEHIDPYGIRGTWGSLSVLPDADKFSIIKY